MKRRTLIKAATTFALLSAAATLAAPAAAATDFPSKPIRLIVPYSAGGNTDVAARLLAQTLSEKIGQSVIIDNRAGANTTVGTAHVAQSQPDGYTLLYTTISFAVNPHIYKQMSYDSKNDFAPVAWVTLNPLMLVASPDVPADNLKDFISYLEANPSTPYGSSGSGGAMHLGAELFRQTTGVTSLHVPYRGESQVLTDLVSGRIKYAFSSPSVSSEYVRAGKMKGIAQAGPRRSPLLPDVPTATESGLDGFGAYTWGIVLAPKGTPDDVVAKLNAAINSSLSNPELNQRMSSMGMDVVSDSTPASTVKFIEEETRKWGEVVKQANITTE